MTEGPLSRRPDLDGLEIMRPLGAGTQAVVWLGRQTALDRLCAVKQVPIPPGADPRRLMREARLLAALAHPHVVAVYDVMATATDAVIVMEYVDSGTLADWIRGGGPSWEGALRITDEVAGAIAAAAAIGVVHRDLKPANILLDERGGCHVGDFGIATLRPPRGSVGAEGVIGTPSYMSPEQARGAGAVPASDVYSLGVVAYQLLCGRLPFLHDDPAAAVRHHALTAPPRPRTLCPDLPGGVERELLRCLDKRPSKRRSASDFAHHLRAAMERGTDEAVRRSRPPGSGPPPSMSTRAHPAGADDLAGLATVALATTADTMTTDEAAPAPAVTVTSPPAGTGAARTLRGPVRGRRHYPWRWIVPVVAAVVVASVAVRILRGGSAPGALQVTGAALAAPSTTGHCPAADLLISADVTVSGAPGTVAYRWHESGDTTSAVATLDVPSGTSHVTLTLQLHFSGDQPSSGAVTLEVTSPSAVLSSPLPVAYTCP